MEKNRKFVLGLRLLATRHPVFSMLAMSIFALYALVFVFRSVFWILRFLND